MIRVAGTQFSLKDKSYEIYLSGCVGENGKHCEDCHNPQLWDENVGVPLENKIDEISKNIEIAGPLVSSIRIFGGEPLEKSYEDLKDFFSFVKSFNREIWLFTRFKFEDVPAFVLKSVDYIKCGSYDNTKKGEVSFYGVTLATTNQVILKKGVDF